MGENEESKKPMNIFFVTIFLVSSLRTAITIKKEEIEFRNRGGIACAARVCTIAHIIGD